jgi:hypothetical protein
MNIFAQSSFTIKPSFFYTKGNYSNNDHSNSFAGYVSGTWNNIDHIIFAFDYLRIAGNDWDYSQNNLVAGIVYNFNSYHLKVNYLKIIGKYSQGISTFNYTDNSNVINIDFIKGDYPFYYGIGYSYFNQSGLPNIKSHQTNLRVEYIPHYKVLFGFRGTVTFTSDNRKLFALAGKINYQPFYELLLKTNFMLGEQALFMDSDLLIIFNQILSQRLILGIQFEYTIFRNTVLVGSFQHTEFESYKINYLVGGVKFNFDL